ncbi:GGDEF domain-containing protein [Dyella sp. EPa41]|uniref:GGDEF domain-containing protein n=1 Tax=Dyella sp. EPa41 TaxID=1561194 RepID=UPI0019154A58|nr:GGDEF domain-containing protein [Dyella sp. EPa41]
MRAAGVLFAVVLIHGVLVSLPALAGGVAPALASIAVQCVAVAAVMARRRRDPAELRTPWLLLAVAASLQVIWAGINVLAALLKDEGGYLTAVGVVCSALYMIPAMLLIARSHGRHEPAAARVLDLALSCLVGVLLYVLITHALPGSPDAPSSGVYVIIWHADAIDFSMAFMAILRMFGARGLRLRFLFYAAASYLLVNAAVAAAYNRIELHGLPHWSTLLVDLPYIALALIVSRRPPRLLRRFRPSLRTSQTIAFFSPIMLSIGVLLLGVSVSRLAFAPGVAVAALAVLYYGLRVAFIQRQHLDLQRAAQLDNESLQRQVGRDPLTGIANRTTLDTRLHEALEDAVRTKTSCSVLMIDIDYFKQFNDRQGHLAGDACLVGVAKALATSLFRNGDLVARYGGEEFAVVLPDTDGVAADAIAQRLIQAVERLHIPHGDSPHGELSVSIGLATQPEGVTIDAAQLLNAADRALYRAKTLGRNRHEVADMRMAPRDHA